MSNFVRGFRLGRGSIKWGLALYDEFIPKTQYELDSIKQGKVMNSHLDDSYKSPNLTQSYIDSVSQANINRQPDRIFSHSFYAGYSKGIFHKFGTSLRKKDSIRYTKEYELDSIIIIEVFTNIKAIKKNK